MYIRFGLVSQDKELVTTGPSRPTTSRTPTRNSAPTFSARPPVPGSGASRPPSSPKLFPPLEERPSQLSTSTSAALTPPPSVTSSSSSPCATLHRRAPRRRRCPHRGRVRGRVAAGRVLGGLPSRALKRADVRGRVRSSRTCACSPSPCCQAATTTRGTRSRRLRHSPTGGPRRRVLSQALRGEVEDELNLLLALAAPLLLQLLDQLLAHDPRSRTCPS